MTENPHILVVTTDPNDPEEYLGEVECNDPQRKHCKLWLECRTCWDNGHHVAGADLAANEITIHGEVHHIYEGMLMTDSGRCISSYDDSAAAEEAAYEVGLGRWYVDVEWCEGLVVNVGGAPERAPEAAPDA